MTRLLFILTLPLALAGCATDPLPKNYAGPVARLLDSVGFSGDMETHIFYSRAEFFFASEIDGKKINESLSATKKKSFGKGKDMDYDIINRDIPIRPLTVKLEGRVTYAPPLFALTHPGSLYSATNTIEFEPVEGQTYIVKGKLAEADSEVWLEEMGTGKRVGTTVEQTKIK
jgi:hypothetical protein